MHCCGTGLLYWNIYSQRISKNTPLKTYFYYDVLCMYRERECKIKLLKCYILNLKKEDSTYLFYFTVCILTG